MSRKKARKYRALRAGMTVSSGRDTARQHGNVRYQLETPSRESLPRERSECFGHGTTHVIFGPLDFIARLAALVPKPRVNLTRFHGVFAPNSKHRALVTPARRGRGSKPKATEAGQEQTPAERRASMSRAHQKQAPGGDVSSGCSISTSRPAGNAAARPGLISLPAKCGG